MVIDRLRQVATPGVGKRADDPRYRAWRRRQLFAATQVASLVLAGLLVFDAAWFGPRSKPLLINNLADAAISIAAFAALRWCAPVRRAPTLATFLVASVALASSLVPLATTSSLDFMTTYIPIEMIAVALFAPWGVRWHMGWLMLATIASVSVAHGPLGARLGPSGADDISAVFFAAATVSLTGFLVLERQRHDMFRQRTQVHDLMLEARAQQRRLAGLATRLVELATHDPMTGVGNRLRMDEDFGELQAGPQLSNPAALVMLDLDRFKAYNDQFGHLAGDDALRRISACCTTELRTGDRFYRFGGEEFLVVALDIVADDALALAERLRSAVAALGIPHPDNPPWGVLTVSAGVAAIGHMPELADEWVRAADAALYAAKAAGRNRVAVAGSGERLPLHGTDLEVA